MGTNEEGGQAAFSILLLSDRLTSAGRFYAKSRRADPWPGASFGVQDRA